MRLGTPVHQGAREQQSSGLDDEECQPPNLGQDGSTTASAEEECKDILYWMW